MSKKKPSKLANELAKAKYGKKYKELSDTQQSQIDKLNDKDLLSKAREAIKAQEFQNAYVDAYAKMSDRGIGLLGKRSKTIRSLEELRFRSKQKQALQKAKQRQIGEELYSEYEGLKSSAYSALSGGKKDAISRKFGGGVWHEINTDPAKQNYRMQTYAEQVADERINIERQNITRDIESLSRKYGENVTSPEFLLQAQKSHDPNLATFHFIIPSFNPAIFQRVSMAKNTMQISNSFFLATFARLIISILFFWVGILLLAQDPNLEPTRLFAYIIDKYVYIGFKGFVAAGVMAMVMSTAD